MSEIGDGKGAKDDFFVSESKIMHYICSLNHLTGRPFGF